MPSHDKATGSDDIRANVLKIATSAISPSLARLKNSIQFVELVKDKVLMLRLKIKSSGSEKI